MSGIKQMFKYDKNVKKNTAGNHFPEMSAHFWIFLHLQFAMPVETFHKRNVFG